MLERIKSVRRLLTFIERKLEGAGLVVLLSETFAVRDDYAISNLVACLPGKACLVHVMAHKYENDWAIKWDMLFHFKEESWDAIEGAGIHTPQPSARIACEHWETSVSGATDHLYSFTRNRVKDSLEMATKVQELMEERWGEIPNLYSGLSRDWEEKKGVGFSDWDNLLRAKLWFLLKVEPDRRPKPEPKKKGLLDRLFGR